MGALYDKKTGRLDVPPGMAVHLRGIGTRWTAEDLLSQFVPERRTHLFALDPRKWESTFWSLTNKDPRKISNYKPELVPIVPGTLVADMVFANLYQRSSDPEAARAYQESVMPIEEAVIGRYRYPELLIPRRNA
jgi:hypothetical protein